MTEFKELKRRFQSLTICDDFEPAVKKKVLH